MSTSDSIEQMLADQRAGRRTADQLTGQALDAAHAHSALNAFVLIHDERARAEAVDRDQAHGDGELHGIPLALKDNIDERGVVCASGCEAYRDRVGETDAEVVTRLRGAGAVILGRTNMHELADGVTSENAWLGPIHNPHRRGYHPGGSSGGSAVAVATGVVRAALGTDTGGSVRIPAALCGVVGFKPTRDRVPTTGVTPLSTTLDHVGVLAATVDEARRVTTVLSGDELTAPLDAEQRLRLGVLDGFGRDPEPGGAQLFHRTLRQLREHGHQTSPCHVEELKRGISLLSSIYPPEAAEHHRALLTAHPERFSEPIRLDLRRGLDDRAADRRTRALEGAAALTTALEATLTEVDLLVTPTTPEPARPFGSGAPHVLLTYTVPFNLAGWPAVSLPMGAVDGLPVGLQIAGPAGSDARVLAAAEAIAAVVRA